MISLLIILMCVALIVYAYRRFIRKEASYTGEVHGYVEDRPSRTLSAVVAAALALLATLTQVLIGNTTYNYIAPALIFPGVYAYFLMRKRFSN